MGRTSYVCGTGWYVMAITGVDNIHNMSESIMCMVIYHIICTLTIFFLMQQRWFCYSLTYSDFHLALLLLVSETEMDYMPYMTISRLIFSTNYLVKSGFSTRLYITQSNTLGNMKSFEYKDPTIQRRCNDLFSSSKYCSGSDVKNVDT